MRAKFTIRKLKSALLRKEISGRLPFDWGTQPYNRGAVILKLRELIDAQRYLEIGCGKNVIFRSNPCPDKIGVDPVRGGTHRTLSDVFFEKNGDTFDLIFIDGLHEYGQIKKDIENALSTLNEGGAIAVHDCLPLCWEDQAVPRQSDRWNGDGWKAIMELKDRPDLDIRVVTVDEGVGLIIPRKNSHVRSFPVQKYREASFDIFLEHYESLGLISFDEINAFFAGDDE